MLICKNNQCTGCMACMNICPKNAIYQNTDSHGFYIPEIDDSLCVNCGLCVKVCPQNKSRLNKQLSEIPKVYAGWCKDDEVRKNSSSGGIFTLLAKEILEKNGVVFGVVFDKNSNIIHHTYVQNLEELYAMRGSKYVQSDVGLIYKNVQRFLVDNRKVLFTGTPCQCDALQSFLGKKYDNLYIIDLICHGVPSPLVFSSYLKTSQKIEQSKSITNINFRDKENSWDKFLLKIKYSDHHLYSGAKNRDAYLRSFSENFCLHDTCYQCKYSNTLRVSDITLGDFWGYLSETKEYRNTDEGISLIILNTLHGNDLFDSIQDSAIFVEKTLAEAVVGNSPLHTPSPQSPYSDQFWEDFLTDFDLQRCSENFPKSKSVSMKHKIRMFIDNHFYMLPSFIKRIYKNMLKRKAGIYDCDINC